MLIHGLIWAILNLRAPIGEIPPDLTGKGKSYASRISAIPKISG